MINDFNSGHRWVGPTGTSSSTETGGPNHVQNLCFAPIHADTQNNDSLIFTPTYYYIGHFSKFIEPGAKRVSTTVSRSTLESTSFQNPDGQIVTVIMNRTDETIPFKLITGELETSLEIAPHAMHTMVY